jgi:periplasmic protein TonB
MAAYVQDNSIFSRRIGVLIGIAAFHVLLAWLLASGLARKVIQTIAEPIQTDLIEEIVPEEEPPPPPPPEFERPPIEIPPPEIDISIPVDPQTTAPVNVTTVAVPKAPPPPPKPAGVRVGAKSSRLPSSEDYYPAASKRLEEQGTSIVKVCVGADNKMTGPPTVTKSSGISRLDEAAVRLAKAGRYKAGTLDGVPMASDCLSFRVRFELKE